MKMWGADFKKEGGEWEPLMNDLSHKRSYEGAYALMYEKIEILLTVKKVREMALQFRLVEFDLE